MVRQVCDLSRGGQSRDSAAFDAAPSPRAAFDSLVRLALDEPGILGLVLTGSQAREGMATDRSDYDVYVVVDGGGDDGEGALARELLGLDGFRSTHLDLGVMSLEDFRAHALPGTETWWNAYSFVGAKVVFDRRSPHCSPPMPASVARRPCSCSPTTSTRSGSTSGSASAASPRPCSQSRKRTCLRTMNREITGSVDDYDPMDTFDQAGAEHYDDSAVRGDEEQTVAALAGLAGGGPALELAIGTGRIALPLAARGVRVDGIDLSEPMVAKLRAKPGGADLSVTIGDFADVAVAGRYRLIYLVFNTLFNLLTQDAQVRCFQNAAEHLTDDGVFVVEAFVPGYLHRLRDNQYVDAEEVGVGHVKFDVARHDPVAQRLDENHVRLSRDGVRLVPVVCRYAWPGELDLMARIAGLRLAERWGAWDRRPLTADDRNCISVYERASASA